MGPPYVELKMDQAYYLHGDVKMKSRLLFSLLQTLSYI